MTVLSLLILLSPFVIAVALGWAAHRSDGLRPGLDQFRVSAPMYGRLSAGGADALRMEHELDVIRTRFEARPAALRRAR
jgi:hypothetical protein